MAYRKFDAKAYWATKPLCVTCKKHKVKSGTICYECRKQNKLATPQEIQSNNDDTKNGMINEDSKLIEAQSINEDFGVAVSPEAQNKIVRLFTYLEKALSLDDTIVRDFRSSIISPSSWWLSDYPQDLDNLFIRNFDKEQEILGEQPSAWLKVQKKNIDPAPQIPEKLTEWVVDVNPLEKPKALDKIDRKVLFSSDKDRVSRFKQFKKDFNQGDRAPKILENWVVLAPNKLPEAIDYMYVPDYWADHPELKKLLTGYEENEWKKWADKVKKIYKANLLYDQLYALRLLLKNEGDTHELLLGHGLLTWDHKAVGAIYSPVFLHR